LTSSQASLEAFNRQLEQQQKRFDVGLSANTDVQEARASRDSANATVISSKRSLASAQEALRIVAGELADTNLAAPADDIPLIIPDPQNQDQWVRKAMEGNLDLAASRLALDASTYDLGTLKTNRYPSLTLGAAYDKHHSFNNFEVSDGVNASGASFSAGISVPIFSGGLISSQIRQGVYQQRAARENVELSSRQTESAARDAYLSMESSIALVEANKQALESTRLALQATVAGFDVGTRTTIDVLTSRKNLLAAEVAYEQSRYDYITNLITLKQVTGSLSRADLLLINSWLTK
jgi:outer membrane protein